jgi:hypothetical protein
MSHEENFHQISVMSEERYATDKTYKEQIDKRIANDKWLFLVIPKNCFLIDQELDNQKRTLRVHITTPTGCRTISIPNQSGIAKLVL